MKTPRETLLDALQIANEDGLGGYADRQEKLFGPAADAIIRWLEICGYEITVKDPTP